MSTNERRYLDVVPSLPRLFSIDTLSNAPAGIKPLAHRDLREAVRTTPATRAMRVTVAAILAHREASQLGRSTAGVLRIAVEGVATYPGAVVALVLAPGGALVG